MHILFKGECKLLLLTGGLKPYIRGKNCIKNKPIT